MAQQPVSQIKVGTQVVYNINAINVGQHFEVSFVIEQFPDPLKMRWEAPGIGKGQYMVSASTIQSGDKLVVNEPKPNELEVVKEGSNLFNLSKDNLSKLAGNQPFLLNGNQFFPKADTTAYQLNDRPVKVLAAETKNGKKKIWILNNPDLPLVFKSINVVPGLDFVLTKLTE